MKDKMMNNSESLENMEGSFSEQMDESLVESQEPASAELASQKFELSISSSLYRKLQDKAKQEGVTLDEFAAELLAEGLVLRAWEIMERKSTMKGQNSQTQTSRAPRQNYNRGNNYSQKGKYRSNGSNFQGKNQKKYSKFSHQDMGDNANFIEYVRSQEKKNSW